MASLYENLFRHVFYPAYETGLRRRRTFQWLHEYEASQWLSPEAVKALQWRKLKALLAHCHAHVPYYREQWQRLDIHPQDIGSMDDFAALPLLTKDDIREQFERLKARDHEDDMLYKGTGGSSGQPLWFGYTRESNERRNAVMWRGYAWAGARMGRRTLFFWGGALSNQTKSHALKERLYQSLFNRHLVNTFGMRADNMGEYADAIDRARPQVIVAYVGPMARLAQWLLDNGRTPWRPASILAAAEPLLPFQRALIERAFGAPVYNTYGCREVMLIASECEQRHGLHVNADHLVVETVPDPAAGPGAQGGAVTVTDLHNYGMPFIRYQNGDLATPMPGTCACGRGLPLLASVDGRRLDALRSPDGHVLPGEFFPHVFKDLRGIREFQVVQRQIDRLDITVVRAPGFDPAELEQVRRETARVVGESLKLQFEFADHIPPGSNGKLRVTRCELA